MDKELEEEIRKIVKEEVYSLFFDRKKFQIPLLDYVKFKVDDRIENIRKKKPNESYILPQGQPEWESGFSIKESVDLKSYYNQLKSENKIDCDEETFLAVLTNKDEDAAINWIHKAPRSKDVQIFSLFDFLNEISDADFQSFSRFYSARFKQYVLSKFLKGGISMKKSNISSSFSNWKKK